MAERGVADAGDNPFSFKTFVNVKDKKVPEKKDLFSDDEDDLFGTSARNTPKTEKSKHDDKAGKKTKQKENPFSFKKFLAGSSVSSKTNETATVPLSPPDIANDINVPSLHHDHFSKETSTSGLSAQTDFSSSGFSLFSANSDKKSGDFSDLKGISSEELERLPSNVGAGKLSIFNDDPENCEPKESEASNGEQASGGILQLPDFLSDGPLHSSKHNSLHVHEKDPRDQDLLGQIRILQDENNQLHKEVSRLKQKCSDKNQRLSQLKNDMERLKKKEAEETAVMEKAVQQVEENLVTTTKRAVQAESTVSKLKQEVKSLQNQLRSLTLENEAYRQGDGGLSDVRERTKYTSDQLKVAALSAEKNLKELMSGVDQLKLLSQVLASWEKITDASPDHETPPASEGKQSSPPS